MENAGLPGALTKTTDISQSWAGIPYAAPSIPEGLNTTYEEQNQGPVLSWYDEAQESVSDFFGTIWGSAKHYDEVAGQWFDDTVEGAYDKTIGGIKRVVTDVVDVGTGAASSALGNLAMPLLIGAGVIIALIYVAGKSGAVKIDRVV